MPGVTFELPFMVEQRTIKEVSKKKWMSGPTYVYTCWGRSLRAKLKYSIGSDSVDSSYFYIFKIITNILI